jgi:SAM-dependent methyltransferase
VTDEGAPVVDDAVDHHRIMAEIQAEARRLRREGVVSPAFERELDVAFGRLAPPAASEDFDATLTSAEELAYVDANVPVLSEKPGGAALKKFVRKAVFFYGKYLTDQVTSFATTAARATRLLARRVDALEDAVPGASTRVRREHTTTPVGDDGAQWAEELAGRLPRDRGRVLVGECGAGGLVLALVAGGVDAYGVEPREQVADAAAAAGVEVREDEVLDHLRLVPPAGVGGIVLVGCVDRLGLGQQLALLDAAAHVLAPGGTLAVVTEGPPAHGTTEEIVAADLAPGRPLHPATWEHLLAGNGFEDVEVRVGDRSPTFQRVPGDGESAAALNHNFERLEALVATPGAALVVGRRAAS